MRDANFAELAEKARPDIEKVRGILSQRRDDITKRMESLRQPLPEPPELAFARFRLALEQKASSDGYDASRNAELAFEAIQEPQGWRKWVPWIRADHRRRREAAQEVLRKANEAWLSAGERRKDAQSEVDRQCAKLAMVRNRYVEKCLAEERRLLSTLRLIEEAETVLYLRPELARHGVEKILDIATERQRMEELSRQEAIDEEEARQRQEESLGLQPPEPPILP